ncbi:hypothetical protein SACC_13270 [Saccharolobus caldissimus]|uniref:Uncharacterized protein n=1 Tax=Saccharolobus caldissimus TaxID=1702097 RepID=A0AAQ4CR79_9CREN|nr:hypothetical protein SACC_13270 [Saccharolobus caldissimus]
MLFSLSLRIIFIDERIDSNTLIGGVYFDLEKLGVIIDCINNAWDKIGKEWEFHYQKDKKISAKGTTIANIFANSLRKYIDKQNTIVISYKDYKLENYSDEFYPAVIFNLYSLPVFLTNSDVALIDPNPQVKVIRPIIKKLSYPQIFYDVDTLINKLDRDTKRQVFNIVRDYIRREKGIAINVLEREWKLKPEETIRSIMKWGLWCADYIVSFSEISKRVIDQFGRPLNMS